LKGSEDPVEVAVEAFVRVLEEFVEDEAALAEDEETVERGLDICV
jgi:hypothetical protein